MRLAWWTDFKTSVAYFAVAGLRASLSGKIEIHNDLLLLVHFRLVLLTNISNTILSSFIIA